MRTKVLVKWTIHWCRIVSSRKGNQSFNSIDGMEQYKRMSKEFYIKKISLDSVVCPRDTGVDCSLEIVSSVNFKDPNREGGFHGSRPKWQIKYPHGQTTRHVSLRWRRQGWKQYQYVVPDTKPPKPGESSIGAFEQRKHVYNTLRWRSRWHP